MFGFSLTKLLFTIVIVIVVWYGFKWLGRIQDMQERRDKERLKAQARTGATADSDAETMIKCPTCGTYLSAAAPKSCGKPDCPYPG